MHYVQPVIGLARAKSNSQHQPKHKGGSTLQVGGQEVDHDAHEPQESVALGDLAGQERVVRGRHRSPVDRHQ